MQSGTKMFLSLDLYHIGTLLRHSHPFWYSIWLMWLWPIFIRRLDADGVSWREERLRDLKKGCVTQVCLRDSWMSFEPWEILVTCVTWQPQQGKAQGRGPPAPHQHSTALKTSGNFCSWLWSLLLVVVLNWSVITIKKHSSQHYAFRAFVKASHYLLY